jgi:CCR4-NOT transcription complex subunit 7/8
MIRGNCDNLKLIQVGIALSNDKGETPRGATFAWQFNLQFDHENEQSINESMELLRQSGFEFDKHKTDGIPHKLFAEYLISSGLVLNARNHWITFHGSGDFGYVLRILLGHNLPNL